MRADDVEAACRGLAAGHERHFETVRDAFSPRSAGSATLRARYDRACACDPARRRRPRWWRDGRHPARHRRRRRRPDDDDRGAGAAGLLGAGVGVARLRPHRARHLPPRRAGRRVRARPLGAADAVAVRGLPAPAGERLHRLGLRARREGPHPHQRARRRLLDRRAGVVLRPPHGLGARDRQGPRHRPRGAVREPEGHGPAPARARRLLDRPRRRPDGRDRQPVRARAHADHRRGLGAAAAHHGPERLRDRGRHPDRRRAQPRQLGRPAARRDRAA